jgi:hypothetical protein
VSRKGRFRTAASDPASAEAGRRSRLEGAALGHEDGERAAPYVALKYFQSEWQCFSEWSRDELRAFSAFNHKLRQVTWPLLYASGGRQKTGLGYTPHDLGALPRPAFADGISEDVAWFELRVTQKARVHGFRAGAAFFLVFLDRNHDAFPA